MSSIDSTMNLTDLGITDKNAGCACCAPTAETAAAPAQATAGAVSTTLLVTGMTCSHCVSSVTEELSEIAGVTSVDVALNNGGTSTVTVESELALDDAAISAAIDEAGYTLVSAARS